MKKLTPTTRTAVVSYVPHGINCDVFKPVDVPSEFKTKVLGTADYEFIVFWSNRNIRRKQASDVIYAFKMFNAMITPEQARKTCLIMHTKPLDENGTDLRRVVSDLAPNINIIFSESKLSPDDLNYLYNISDCTINIAVNEGFGLTTAESVMAGTPIIVNVTGGLQDQCGFRWVDTGQLVTATDYLRIGTLSNHRLWKGKVVHGNWVFPVWSVSHSLNGSLPTPYIWEDRVDLYDVASTLLDVYNIPKNVRDVYGRQGRAHFINEMGLSHVNMNKTMIDSIEATLSNWTPRTKFDIYQV
jgi:hypothetical protein